MSIRSGLVPKLNVPYELIFWFCSPAEIRTFVTLTDAGDKLDWLKQFQKLVVALDAEQFPIYQITGTGIDLTPLIHNPKGYPSEMFLRIYREDYFW